MKKSVVDNTAIENFYDACEELVSRWNAARYDGGGEIKISLEDLERHTTKKTIRLDAEPHPVPSTGRMTLLQIWFDHENSVMMAKTPFLPIDNSSPVTIDKIQQTLLMFDP